MEVGGQQQCKDNNDVWVECDPRQYDFTTDSARELAAATCQFPFRFNGQVFDDCMPTSTGIGGDTLDLCISVLGEWIPCDNGLGVAPAAAPSSASECHFPFVFNGAVRSECVTREGSQMCRNADDNWILCPAALRSPDIAATSPPVAAPDACSFPFVYDGVQHSECVDRDGSPQCRDAGDLWISCEVPPAWCALPFVYEGESHSQCIDVLGVLKCKDAGDEWIDCDSPAPGTPGGVAPGECQFPFVYRGVSRNECVENLSQLQCKTPAGEWIDCPAAVRERMLEPAATGIDDECRWPLEHEGKLVHNCVDVDGGPKCKSAGGRWIECDPGTELSCAVPFVANGALFLLV